MEGTVQLQVRVATVAADDRMHFVIDGVAHAPFALPETRGGQKWATVEAGEWTLAPRSEHTVVLVMDTGGISINWWGARKLLPQKSPTADAGAAVP